MSTFVLNNEIKESLEASKELLIVIMWAGVPAELQEELYDDVVETQAEMADAGDDEGELYQEAADTRTAYRQSDNEGISARALYDYQAGRWTTGHCCFVFRSLSVLAS